jgi:hypothetical protein
MSKLEFYARPLVAFDPSDKQHRRFYYEFLESRTWGRCPVRFICPDQTGADLVKMMQTQLVDWYVRQEFKKASNVNSKRTTKGRS